MSNIFSLLFLKKSAIPFNYDVFVITTNCYL